MIRAENKRNTSVDRIVHISDFAPRSAAAGPEYPFSLAALDESCADLACDLQSAGDCFTAPRLSLTPAAREGRVADGVCVGQSDETAAPEPDVSQVDERCDQQASTDMPSEPQLLTEPWVPPWTSYLQVSQYEMCEAQLADPDIEPIFQAMNHVEVVLSVDIRDFVMVDELLYQIYVPRYARKQLPREFRRRLYLRACYREKVMATVHCSHFHTCHAGSDKLFTVLSDIFYWPRMAQDCVRYTNSCDTCIKRKAPRGSTANKAPFSGHSLPPRAFYRVYTDVYGPLVKSEPDGYRFIITFVCGLTSYAVFLPMKSTTSGEVIACLQEYINQVCLPIRELYMDRASYYMSREFMDCLRSLSISPLFTAPHVHRSNAKAETVNSHLGNVLSFFTKGKRNQWPEFITDAQRSHNMTVNCTMEVSPAEMVYGYDPAGEPDVMTTDEVQAVHAIQTETSLRRDRILEFARDNFTRKQKRWIDRRGPGRVADIANGDTVYVEVPEGVDGKLGDRFDGPFVVIDVLADYTYQLRRLKTGRIHPHPVHVERIRKFKPFKETSGKGDGFDAPHDPTLPEVNPSEAMNRKQPLHVVPEGHDVVEEVISHRREGRRRHVKVKFRNGEIKEIPYSWCDLPTRQLIDKRIREGTL